MTFFKVRYMQVMYFLMVSDLPPDIFHVLAFVLLDKSCDLEFMSVEF